MSEDERDVWLKKLGDARRLAMVQYLADRHDEGNKISRFVEELEQFGRSNGWPVPAGVHESNPVR